MEKVSSFPVGVGGNGAARRTCATPKLSSLAEPELRATRTPVRLPLPLMVSDTSVPSIRQARRLIDTFAEEAMTLPIEMVVNFEKRPMVLRSHHKAAAKVLKRPLSHWLPSDPKTAREAIDRGVPVSQVAGRAGLTKGIQRLAKDVRATLSTTQKQTTARQSA